MKQTHLLFSLSILMYIVAWFLPVFKGNDLFGEVPGWQAFFLALSIIWDTSGRSEFGSLLGPVSALTNAWFLTTAIFCLLPQKERTLRVHFAGLVACSLINAMWIPTGELFLGYYAWLGSFLLLALFTLLIIRTGLKSVAFAAPANPQPPPETKRP